VRVTIDLDTQTLLGFLKVILKAWVVLRRLPDFIRRTQKGYHFIWKNVNVKASRIIYLYRTILGDDKNRIRLDDCSKKRVKQILFYKKKVSFK